MAEPVQLLLDVDGVVNADRLKWPDKDMHAKVAADGETYPFRWSPLMMDALDDLHHRRLVEIWWCTTWCHEAATLNALFGVDYRAAWTESLDPRLAQVRKLSVARAALAAGRRLIWCDDEAIPRAKDRRCLGMTGDALFITPYPRSGLTPKHLKQIEAFAAAGPAARCG